MIRQPDQAISQRLQDEDNPARWALSKDVFPFWIENSRVHFAGSEGAPNEVVLAAGDVIEGADLIDLGAESSRPGAIPATLDEEMECLLPVLDALADCPVPISV